MSDEIMWMIGGDKGATYLDDFVKCNFVRSVFSIGGEVTSPVNNVHKLGYLADRVLRVFTIDHSEKIVSTFHTWEHEKDAYADTPVFAIAGRWTRSPPSRKDGGRDEQVSHSISRIRMTAVGDLLRDRVRSKV